MKTPEEAVKLAELMVNIGHKLDKSITAVVTSMEEPLGRAVGNSIEVIESLEFLKGNIVNGDIAELTYDFGTIALLQTGMFIDEDTAKSYLREIIHTGKAIQKFKELVIAQGGDADVVDDYSKFPQSKFKIEIKSEKSGYVSKIDAYKIAYGCKLLGAGREKKTDSIDYSVGVFLNKKTGEKVEEGNVLYTIYSNDEAKTAACQKYCDEAFEFTSEKTVMQKQIYKIVK